MRPGLNAALPGLTRRRTLPAGTAAGHHPAASRWRPRPLVRAGAPARAAPRPSPASRAGCAWPPRQLGPTYIKLGQIIASGDGIFPPELVAEFKWCRDQVPAEPWPVVERVLTEELGGPSPRVFASVEHTPLAAASIAQVHAATLRDGTPVVVKVQRPAVASRVRQDLAVMAWLAPHLVGRIPVAALANPPALVELFAETIIEELDFRLEAENMLDIAMTFAALDQRYFVVPRPHPTLVTRRMLVMERLDGFKFGDVEGMQAAGIDTEAVVRAGMIGFLEGVHDARHLPRRPPRREPLRAAVGEDRAAGLRHHGPPDRGQAPGPALPAGRGVERRHPRPGGRPARPRRLPRRRRRAARHRRCWGSTGRRSIRPR